jgi:ABC-type multidrug transport system fused ATPase/permease subunit
VSLADRAVVLEDGLIVEDAPPRSLIAAGGTFERLFGDEVRVA